jgi:hypothetical protein
MVIIIIIIIIIYCTWVCSRWDCIQIRFEQWQYRNGYGVTERLKKKHTLKLIQKTIIPRPLSQASTWNHHNAFTFTMPYQQDEGLKPGNILTEWCSFSLKIKCLSLLPWFSLSSALLLFSITSPSLALSLSLQASNFWHIMQIHDRKVRHRLSRVIP